MAMEYIPAPYGQGWLQRLFTLVFGHTAMYSQEVLGGRHCMTKPDWPARDDRTAIQTARKTTLFADNTKPVTFPSSSQSKVLCESKRRN